MPASTVANPKTRRNYEARPPTHGARRSRRLTQMVSGEIRAPGEVLAVERPENGGPGGRSNRQRLSLPPGPPTILATDDSLQRGILCVSASICVICGLIARVGDLCAFVSSCLRRGWVGASATA